MTIFKKALGRRTFLRGVGATVALPLLDAMVPALTATVKSAARPVGRLGFIYTPNGFMRDKWVPSGVGSDFVFSPTLGALAPFRDQLLVVTGLAQRQAFPLGDPPGTHSRCSGAWITCVHPKATEGADVRAGTSADQVAAATLGQETVLPSLELATEQNEQMIGNCEAGYSCVYQNTVSWRTHDNAPADGGPPARRVRTTLWRRIDGRGTARSVEDDGQYPRFCHRAHRRPRSNPRAQRSGSPHAVPRVGP